jgi:hypothetical protein
LTHWKIIGTNGCFHNWEKVPRFCKNNQPVISTLPINQKVGITARHFDFGPQNAPICAYNIVGHGISFSK